MSTIKNKEDEKVNKILNNMAGAMNGINTGAMKYKQPSGNASQSAPSVNNSIVNKGTESLLSTKSSTNPVNTASTNSSTVSSAGKNTTPVNEVDKAYANYQNLLQNQPAAYQSSYSDRINGILDKILNREDFSYNVLSDPVYQQYKDQYTRLGQQAMQDTMANAATLTGGFGNSYASTAGNQAYQSYLQNLNDVIPSLQEAAYNRYMSEYDALYDRLAALESADNLDYQRHRDNVSDYYNNLANAQSNYDMLYNNDLNERSLKASAAVKTAQGSNGDTDTQEVTSYSDIKDIMTDTAYKKMQDEYDTNGIDGVYDYLNKQANFHNWSDEEMSYIYDYLQYELGWNMGEAAAVQDDKSWVKWDAISNSPAGRAISQNYLDTVNHLMPVKVNTREKAINAGVPASKVLTEQEYAARQHSAPTYFTDTYEGYLTKLVNEYLGLM